jgi:NAD(P)-dependent dehydrogenase (short-subunit alcohol dehydrogenase family)
MMGSQRKVAIVTGSGRGIGRGIATLLARAGWAIVVNGSKNPKNTEETLALVEAEGSEGLIVLGDIACAADRDRLVDATLERFGKIDLLVNNAGVGPRVRMDMLEMGIESMHEVLEINTVGPFFLTQRVSKLMIQHLEEGKIQNPKIVNISSISAYTSSTSRAEYCISKAAISMVTQLFADRLAEYGINVYEIRPGIIKTPLTEVVREKYDKLIAEGITPIKRWGQPEDVAKAIVAIAEDYLPFSTGQVINVDGGFHIHRL